MQHKISTYRWSMCDQTKMCNLRRIFNEIILFEKTHAENARNLRNKGNKVIKKYNQLHQKLIKTSIYPVRIGPSVGP